MCVCRSATTIMLLTAWFFQIGKQLRVKFQAKKYTVFCGINSICVSWKFYCILKLYRKILCNRGTWISLPALRHKTSRLMSSTLFSSLHFCSVCSLQRHLSSLSPNVGFVFSVYYLSWIWSRENISKPGLTDQNCLEVLVFF